MKAKTKRIRTNLIDAFSKLYSRYIELRFLLPKNRETKSELELITTYLASSEFSVRVFFYKRLLEGMNDYAKCELFENADWIKKRAEDYKAHILD